MFEFSSVADELALLWINSCIFCSGSSDSALFNCHEPLKPLPAKTLNFLAGSLCSVCPLIELIRKTNVKMTRKLKAVDLAN